jgi:copper chaperone
METLQIPVEGMSCGGCVKSVTNVLQQLAGVAAVEVSLEQKRATVTYDAAQTGLPQFRAAIEGAGFDVAA